MSEQLIERLREARPGAAPDRAATARARGAVLAAVASTGAQGEARRRRGSRWPGSTRLALVAAAFVLVLAVAPAVAYVTGALDFSDRQPAPPAVQKQFADLGSGAPTGMDPHVEQLSTRKVQVYSLTDGRHTLWVAPTKTGGYCFLFSRFAGGCRQTRTAPGVIEPQGEVDGWRIGVTTAFHSPGPPGPTMIGGDLLARPGTTLELEYDDGATSAIPVTFVSPPIDAGFFLFAVPAAHQREGRVPVRLIARAASGDVLAATAEQVQPRDTTAPTRLPPVPQKVWRPDWPLVARVATQTQHAGVVSIEIRRGGPHRWAETVRHGDRIIGGGEVTWHPDRHEVPISIGVMPIGDDLRHPAAELYEGELREGVAAQAVYADGSTEPVAVVRPRLEVGPDTGFFLFELTKQRLARHVVAFEALDGNGAVVARVRAPAALQPG